MAGRLMTGSGESWGLAYEEREGQTMKHPRAKHSSSTHIFLRKPKHEVLDVGNVHLIIELDDVSARIQRDL